MIAFMLLFKEMNFCYVTQKGKGSLDQFHFIPQNPYNTCWRLLIKIDCSRVLFYVCTQRECNTHFLQE
jgi:hypothetical protein